MHHALLVLNGEPPSKALIRRLAARTDLVVAADGGANSLQRCGVTPDYVVGDLDSILPSTKRGIPADRFVRVPDPNRTDFEKSLRFLVRKGVTAASVTGMVGGRIDFTLANFAAIWKYVPKMELGFFGDDWSAFPVKKTLHLSVPVHSTVSLIPFGRCSGITLKGFRYPLNNATLNFESKGSSNLTTASAPTIRLKRGKLLAVVLGTPVF